MKRDLSARLGLNQDEGEKWIVNLIRDTRMDGKLDYQEGTVLMNHPANSVYQQVRIKHLLFFSLSEFCYRLSPSVSVLFHVTRVTGILGH